VIFSTGYGKVLDLGGGGYGVFYNDLPYAPPPPLNPKTAQKADADLTARTKAAMETGRALFPAPQSAPLPRWISGDAGANWSDYRARINATLPERLTRRDEINRIYVEGMGELEGITPLGHSAHGWRYNLRATRRDEFLAHIFQSGLFASVHYYPAADLFGGPPCPVAKALYSDILNLFNDQHFSARQARRIVSLARDFYSPTQ